MDLQTVDQKYLNRENNTLFRARFTPRFSCGLIINSYNQPEYLVRVLNSLTTQSVLPDEVLIADDGSTDETRRVIDDWRARAAIPVQHVWQEHTGFRRSRILNLTISRATADYLIFLDGDTVPHPEFVSDHLRLAQPGIFVQGHRCLVGKTAARSFGLNKFRADRVQALLSGQLSGVKHAFHWPAPWRRIRTDLKGIRGCNLGIWRRDLIAVNGYNEAFTGWGREDSELAVRLMNSGVQRLDVRGWALCFHLWHPPASRATLDRNDNLLAAAQNEKQVRCAQGLNQHLPASASPTTPMLCAEPLK
jgi:glycosyltransferase involved in cell wall biosynthesis